MYSADSKNTDIRTEKAKSGEIKEPGRVTSYFLAEKGILVAITVTGIIYNIGMTAGPWFEGKLAQCTYDIWKGTAGFYDMLKLVITYVLVILFVQFTRFLKRLYVRKFANNINRSMKMILYRALVRKTRNELTEEGSGSIMTKAISDVDACVEGMRKFTTEVFDTGVVMVAYMAMLLYYDWRLALLSIIFPPAAFLLAEKLKKLVSKTSSEAKKSMGRLNEATLDRVSNALTYRVYGQEANQNRYYDGYLENYEKASVRANVWETAMQPIYKTIALVSVIMILYLGGRNVMGTGWTQWDIAAISTFLACFLKLAVKTGKAAKLFNAVQKASVSWKRVKPFMAITEDEKQTQEEYGKALEMRNISFNYPEGPELFRMDNLKAEAGNIIGVTGEVACGKSAFGKLFLEENPFRGEILYDGKKLGENLHSSSFVGYMGHQPELFADTLEDNITLGERGDISAVLKAAALEKDLRDFPEGTETVIGNSGVRLSGGQQARVALARTLYNKRPVLVLDDPFSAVDMATEREIFETLRKDYSDCIIILISHRLTLFPEMDRVLMIENGVITVSDHNTLMQADGTYSSLYRKQTEGVEDNE